MQLNIKTTSLLVSLLLSSITVSAAESAANCSWGRKLTEDHGQHSYVVKNRAPTLYMISRDLYGATGNWHNIAQWNQLREPYTLSKGQTLIIKTPPTVSEAEGTKALIAAYTRLNLPKKAQSLTEYLQVVDICAPSAKKEVPVVAAATVVAQHADESSDEVKIVTKKVEPVPTAEETNKQLILPPSLMKPAERVEAASSENKESHEGHGGWAFSAALVGSSFTLTSKVKETETTNKYKANFNYGIDLGVTRHFAEQWGVSFVVGFEKIDIKSSDVEHLENPSKSYLKFALSLDYEITPAFVVYLDSLYVQRPGAKPTAEGAEIEAIYVPEFSLGARYSLFENEKFNTWITAEGIYSMETTYHDTKLKSGNGYAVGFIGEYKMDDRTASFAPSYRYLKQDTHETEDKQDAFLFQFGLDW